MTFKPTVPQLTAALAWAQNCQPLESCGVIADGAFEPITNIATEHDTFCMDAHQYARIGRDRTIQAIVHSHVYVPPRPSEGDRAMCEKTGLPWLIVSWPLETFVVIEPCGWRAPLIGRQWAWGSHDCYGLIRDGFLEHAGIALPDFARDWLFWKNGADLIGEHFADAGFVAIPQGSIPKHCDVFGMQLNAPVVNHLGLFLDPDVILHQLMGRLSVREVYGGVYQRATVFHLRHRSRLAGGNP